MTTPRDSQPVKHDGYWTVVDNHPSAASDRKTYHRKASEALLWIAINSYGHYRHQINTYTLYDDNGTLHRMYSGQNLPTMGDIAAYVKTECW